MTTATESLLYNALPLLLLAGAYFVVAVALVPAVWRNRHGAHPLDVATVTIFPTLAFSAAMLAVLVIVDRRPLGGQLWFSFAAIVVALVPSILLLARWRERGMLTSRARRVRDAEALVSMRDRELGAVAAISNDLVRAGDEESASRPLVRQVNELLDVDFTAVAVVDEARTEARGVLAELNGEDVDWWRELRLDLVNEPSGIASAVFDGVPVEVYDVPGSGRVSKRLAERVGALSGIWVPMIAEGRVIGVFVAATTRESRSFTGVEVSLLTALASETALALDRLRSSGELGEALEREQAIARIARNVRAELDSGEVIRVATDELRAALGLERASVELGPEVRQGIPIELGGERAGTLVLERAVPFTDGERFLIETVARELALALHTARLLAENERRLAQHGALLLAAQVVASELELEAVLHRLVEEVTKLLSADAADCYLLDPDRGVLRCAAVYGLEEDVVGFEFPADRGVAGMALRRGRPVVSDQYDEISAQVPHPAYAEFSHAIVAPMIWGGETRGVLGVGIREANRRRLGDEDTNILEAFAGLVSLALRNAETFDERARQVGVQRAFYRIASVLSEPLSLTETCDAAAQAAAEALGGDFGAVLMPGRGGRLVRVGGYELPGEIEALELPPALVETARDARMLAAPSVGEDERLPAAWRAAPFDSLLAIPVEGTGRGLVLVFFREARSLSTGDLELGRQLASAARGAFERSRLFEAERAARSLSQRLARTGRLLATELDPAALVVEVVELAVELLDADAGALASLRDDRLVITAAVGSDTEPALGAESPSTGWLGGDVVQLRAPIAREDVSGDAVLATADPVLALGYRAYLGVPLGPHEGPLHGVLAVYGAEARAWREEEIEALSALAANASVALANAELYQRVALEHEQSAAILSNIADGIVAVDRDGSVVVWNAAAEAITGVPATEALGRSPAQVLQRDFQSESGGANRLVSITRGRDELWLSLSEAVMRDPAGAIAGRIFAFRDISSEWALEQMKSDFVSTVSHELRTPLTSIYGFAETLLRSDVEFTEAERRIFLGYIATESERLTQIVDVLLSVARLETGDLQVDLEPTDVGAVVSEAVTSAGPPGNGHRFVVDLEDGPLEAQADPDKLRQVLDQLVENAVKYSPDGGVVRIEARRRPHAVEVSVADEGIGIPQAHLERIFDKFYRVGEHTTGTGLGLFIAKGLVSAMGGRIHVDSEEGRGSRFAFELPATGDD